MPWALQWNHYCYFWHFNHEGIKPSFHNSKLAVALNFTLHLDYPVYFVAFCLLAGGIYAILMYYNQSFGERDSFWAFPNWVLALLRFITVSVIAFLLLSPFVKSYYKELKKPIVAVALDNSASIPLNRDSAYYKDTFPDKIDELIDNLKVNYEVQTLTFDKAVASGQTLNYNGRETNLTKPLQNIYNKYYNRNLGAIVLATDGINNQGQNPLSFAQQLKQPIYPVALGDTIPPKDWKIRGVLHNDIVYAGSEFPVEVQVRAEGMKDKEALLQIYQEGEKVYQANLKNGSNEYDTTIRTLLSIQEPGLKAFKAKLSAEADEVSKANNKRSFYIEALESKKQIAIIANQPHPDVGVLKKSLESKDRYEVSSFTLQQWQTGGESLDGYNVVIFHQLPDKSSSAKQLVQKAHTNEIPSLYVVGNNTSLSALNQVGVGVTINRKNNKPNQVRPFVNDGFNAFTISGDLKKLVKKLPPGQAPYGEYRLNLPHRTLLSQKIGDVKSEKPLLTFLKQPNYKVGLLASTGIWRWYLSEYRIKEKHKAIPELVAKTMQYLALDTEKRQFRLINQQNQYRENERIQFKAEFYNESYEPVQDAEITIDMTNQAGKTYQFDFTPFKNGYKLEAGYLPVGKYDFNAKAKYGGEAFNRSGTFVVKPVNKEHLNTVANHTLLNSLAKKSGGRVIYPRNLRQLPKKLEAAGELKTTANQKYRLQELIHLKSLFLVLLFLLSAEWFLRKYYGGY